MKAENVYKKLDKDFIKPKMWDEWTEYMNEVKNFLSEEFKERSMGLVCDNTDEINRVYTAVFPTKNVMEIILDKTKENEMLFVHHPSIWDIRNAPNTFYQMDRSLLQKFKEKNISIYNLHVPLDNYSEYSTSVNLAKKLRIQIQKPFGEYRGALCGVFGQIDLSSVKELKERFEHIIGHRASLYQYGKDVIQNGRIAVVAGGGNDIDSLSDVVDENINTFVTGITAKNEHSMEAHNFAEENGINILGGTHYSTEKFACKKMCEYFEEMGLPSEFIPGTPILEDL